MNKEVWASWPPSWKRLEKGERSWHFPKLWPRVGPIPPIVTNLYNLKESVGCLQYYTISLQSVDLYHQPKLQVVFCFFLKLLNNVIIFTFLVLAWIVKPVWALYAAGWGQCLNSGWASVHRMSLNCVSLLYRVLEFGQLAWGESFGFESPGFISGCWGRRLWEKV